MKTEHPWSRFVRFIDEDGRELCGEPIDKNLDVGLALASNQRVTVKVLDSKSALTPGQFTGEHATIKKLLSPVASHEIGTIRCIGLNFKDHAAELKLPLPKVPEIFMKPAECLNNPSDAIIIPKSAENAVDAEVELAIVIGRDCKNVDAASALDHVLGYTTANDITCRDVQGRTSQWGYCKGYDGFCPLGPVLVSSKSFAGPLNLSMKTTLDGETLQNGTTDDMIFSIADIVAYLSQDTTLPKGTVILTGTPSGIGHSHNPPRYLSAGCQLHVGISPLLGTLTNVVVSQGSSQSRL